MDYSARLAGSSVFPFSIIGKSILGFLFLMVIIHLIVNFMRHDLPPKSRKKLTTKIGGGILSIALAIAIGFGLYWLVPPPHVIRTTPNRGSAKATQDGRIEVVFDRPVSRTEMKKTITPETPGVWVFEQPTYNTHLTRKVVFYPQETLSPDTEYTITLSGISNTLKLSTPYNYEYSFRTHKDPIVEKVIPGKGERLQETGIKIFLSESAEGSHIELEFFPTISFETKLDSERRVITVIPREKLEPSAHYRMKVFLTDMRKDLSTKEMIEEGQLAEVFDGSFQTQGLPGIASVIPVGGQVAIDDTVAVRFTKPMNKQSVEQNFLIEPEVEGKIDWADDYLLVFNPEKYEFPISLIICSMDDAKVMFAQSTLSLKISKVRSEVLSIGTYKNTITNEIIKNSDLRNKVEKYVSNIKNTNNTVTYSVLSTQIDNQFKPKTKLESEEIASYLTNFMNFLVYLFLLELSS